jgi:parvulin-like peptidyl-prolyl isomerase
MKKIMILIMLLLLVGCSNEEPVVTTEVTEEEPVEEVYLAKVNGEIISIETFDKYYAMQSYDFEKEFGESVWDIEQDCKTMREIRQDQTLDYLIRVVLIEDYLKGKGDLVDPEVIDTAYDRYMESIKNDNEIQAYFEANGIDQAFLKRFLEDQYYLRLYEEQLLEEISNDPKTQDLLFTDKVIRYKTRHILLDSQDTLNEVLALLNDEENPADFSDMARLYSIHATSAVKGGDLGYMLVGTMPGEYEKVALEIEPYTVSEPIQTEYGFHLIFVDDRQMLQDMIESGMPEDEINSYKADVIKKYAATEIIRLFDEMKAGADIEANKEILNER